MSGETILSSPAKQERIRELKENSPVRTFLDDDSMVINGRADNHDLNEFLL